jgi:hypothetical protein
LQNIEKIFANAYELELPTGIGISLIFNVGDLYPFKETKGVSINELVSDEYHTIEWKEKFPKVVQKDIEAVLTRKWKEGLGVKSTFSI